MRGANDLYIFHIGLHVLAKLAVFSGDHATTMDCHAEVLSKQFPHTKDFGLQENTDS